MLERWKVYIKAFHVSPVSSVRLGIWPIWRTLLSVQFRVEHEQANFSQKVRLLETLNEKRNNNHIINHSQQQNVFA